MGCDQTVHEMLQPNFVFQSTHPVWGATLWPNDAFHDKRAFQSTHPVWGATKLFTRCCNQTLYFNPRTPCGVRRFGLMTLFMISAHFNPRTPCGVRLHDKDINPDNTPQFQSTHPVWGATFFRLIPSSPTEHFNPRTPCGVRL